MIGTDGSASEAANGHGRPIERQRRDDRVDTRAVGQAGVYHRRRLIHAAAYARNDTVDDLQQVAIVAKSRVDAAQDAALFHEDMILVVDQDVGDLRIFEQRLQGPEAEDFIEQIGLDLLLLLEAERHALFGDDLVDEPVLRPAALDWS